MEALFLDRPNRFVVRARRIDRKRAVRAHLPDPGRLGELLVAGRRIWLRAEGAARLRKTRWTAVLVETPESDGLVSLDTTLPNRLIAEALRQEALAELAGWRLARREAALGRSRIDFVLARGETRLALEVKSVTLVEDGLARFPDAVTARGARHVAELAQLHRRPQWQAAILFVLQRRDANRIVAAPEIDPVFAEALAQAKRVGVSVLGRRCHVSLERVTLGDPLPAG